LLLEKAAEMEMEELLEELEGLEFKQLTPPRRATCPTCPTCRTGNAEPTPAPAPATLPDDLSRFCSNVSSYGGSPANFTISEAGIYYQQTASQGWVTLTVQVAACSADANLCTSCNTTAPCKLESTPGVWCPAVNPEPLKIVQSVAFTALSESDWAGATKVVFEAGYGAVLYIYNTVTGKWIKNAAVTSTASAARRAGITVEYTATVPAEAAVTAKAQSEALAAPGGAALMVAAVTSAKTALVNSGAVTAADASSVTLPTEASIGSVSAASIEVTPTAAPTTAPTQSGCVVLVAGTPWTTPSDGTFTYSSDGKVIDVPAKSDSEGAFDGVWCPNVAVSSSSGGGMMIIIVIVVGALCCVGVVGGALYYFMSQKGETTVQAKQSNIGVEMKQNEPPPGAVYMKNGVWLDANNQPVTQV